MSNWINHTAQSLFNLSNNTRAATSNWGSLNNDLIATFVQVDLTGKETGVAYRAVVKDGSWEQSFNWTSPFENMNAEEMGSRVSLMKLAQTGGIGSINQLLGQITGNENDGLDTINATIAGKTSITKMNSRQVFGGHAPMKLSMTLLFRAWSNPQSEVAAPFNALLEMAYPKKIADNVAQASLDGANTSDKVVDALFPSQAPLFCRLTYKGETYPLMVFESVSKPLDAPYSYMGDVWLEIPVSLETRHSLDFSDFANLKTGILGTATSEKLNAPQTCIQT